MQTNFSDRNKLIDICKGIGICVIVAGHAGMRAYSTLVNLLSIGMVPIFFWSAGECYSEKKNNDYIWSKIKRLVIPFMITNASYLLLNELCRDMYIFYGKRGLYNILSDVFCWQLNMNCTLPLWFLPCLFWVYILWDFLYKIGRRFHSNWIIAVLILIILPIYLIVNSEQISGVYWGGVV